MGHGGERPPGERTGVMSTSSRDALARGDIRALVETLGPDESDEITMDLPGRGRVTVYAARLGTTGIGVDWDGDVTIHTHDDQDSAAACYARNVIRARMVAESLGAIAAETDPVRRAYALNSLMAQLVQGQEDGSEVPDTVPADWR
jgi:hypothetical protein